MQAPRLNEVLARVVAWHNRHPLARRIQPSQVHGIGEVVLPFASATPLAPPAAAAAPAHLPTIEELLAAEAIPPEVARFDALVRRATQRPAAEAGATAPAALTADDHDAVPDAPDGEAALEIPLLDHGDAPDEAGDPAGPEPGPATGPTAGRADAAETDLALADAPTRTDAPRAAPDGPRSLTPTEAAMAAHVDLGETPAPPAPALPAAATAAAALPAAAPPLPGWRRLLARLPGLNTGPRRPRLQAVFSEDFLWPLSPARIARWARRHGALQALAPADWPHRVITTDPRLRAVQRLRGQVHETPLHVLSAAIGVGDRRMRVLLAPDGAVLGPRAYSPPRLALAAGVAAVALLAGGWCLRQLAAGPAAAQAALPAVAPAASAPLAAPAASAAASALAGDAASAVTNAAASAPAASAAADGAASQATAPARDSAAAMAGHGTAPAATAAPHAAAATATPPASLPTASAAGAATPAAQVAQAAAPAADAASAAQASIRPQLSDEARYAARVQAAALRGEAPPPPPAPPPVYAVVTLPERQREGALRAQALMQAATAKLSGPAPEHAELMGQAGQWRAAWWPFATLVDAERARVLLAGRGLKAEVVEF